MKVIFYGFVVAFFFFLEKGRVIVNGEVIRLASPVSFPPSSILIENISVEILELFLALGHAVLLQETPKLI